MLEQLFQRNLQKHKNAPMLEERIDYLNHLVQNGATAFRLKLVEGYLLRAIEFLHLEDNRIVTEEEIDEVALKWGKLKTNHHLKRSFSKSGQRLFAMYTKSWMRYLNRLYRPIMDGEKKVLNEIYETSHTLKRHLGTPMLQERIAYLVYLKSKGKDSRELKEAASYIIQIEAYLHLEDGRTVRMGELYDAAYKWACRSEQEGSFFVYGKKYFIKNGLGWLEFLQRIEFTPEEKDPLLNQLFKVRHALIRQTKAPLLNERLLLLHHRKEQGVKLSTLYHEANILLVIIHNLDFYSLRPVTVTELIAAADKWSGSETKYCRTENYIHKYKLWLIYLAKLWLSMFNCLIDDTQHPIHFQKELDEYLCFQLEDRGLSGQTIISRETILKCYLTIMDKRCSAIGQITPDIIDDVIIQRTQTNLSRRTIRTELSVLKSFFCFAKEKGWCTNVLSASIRIPRIYQYELLPSAPERADVQRLISECKMTTPTHIRDFAILQLLTVYGLRSGEIAALQLEDLDWRKETIHIKRSKGCKPQLFPLNRTVGEAIIRYLQESRPNKSTLREVFLTRVAPYRALNNGSIYAIVNRRMKPMNLNIKSHGPHSLRHACATYLINSGFSLKGISDYLGHQNIETTRIYAKVDLVNLHKVADINWEDVL